MKFMLKDDVE